MFEYDQSAPPTITVVSSENHGDVEVKSITYPSPVTGKPIAAYVVSPPGQGPFPGVMYVHWLEPSSPTSNRSQFLDEAVVLAQESGVMALLPDAMWSSWVDPSWYLSRRNLQTDYDDAIRQVIELRRGLDVLLAQPGIDAARIAHVGHDFGGMYGSLLAGVDHRAIAYVMIAAASNFNEWMLFDVPDTVTQDQLDAYKTRMDTLAPTRFIAEAGAPVLFQFGTHDVYTPEETIKAFFDAAREPKSLKLYDTEHAMTLDEIRADRLDFLRQQLRV